jgi:hypothetical protein
LHPGSARSEWNTFGEELCTFGRLNPPIEETSIGELIDDHPLVGVLRARRLEIAPDVPWLAPRDRGDSTQPPLELALVPGARGARNDDSRDISIADASECRCVP